MVGEEEHMSYSTGRDEPLISVILPVYNIEKYLPACMEALFRQSYSNLEFVMVDDGSTDQCGALCDAYGRQDARVSVYHKPNGGLSDARNYGIERAKGEYITCVDADDTVDEDYVEYLWNVLQKYNARMSICQLRFKYDGGGIRETGTSGDEEMSAEQCLERMLYHDRIDTTACAKLYHKSLFGSVRFPKGKLFEDIGTTYALMLQCDRIAVGWESKYVYHVHSNSIVNSEFKPAKLDLLEMTDHMAREVTAAYPTLGRAAQRRRVYARFSTLNQMLNARGCDRERREIIAFIKANRWAILRDARAPRRDKLAMIMLSLSYGLYRKAWLGHQKRLMGETK